MKRYDNYVRWLYKGHRPNLFARVQNQMSAIVFASGIWPTRLATLEVRGRRSAVSHLVPGGDRGLRLTQGHRSRF